MKILQHCHRKKTNNIKLCQQRTPGVSQIWKTIGTAFPKPTADGDWHVDHNEYIRRIGVMCPIGDWCRWTPLLTCRALSGTSGTRMTSITESNVAVFGDIVAGVDGTLVSRHVRKEQQQQRHQLNISRRKKQQTRIIVWPDFVSRCVIKMNAKNLTPKSEVSGVTLVWKVGEPMKNFWLDVLIK